MKRSPANNPARGRPAYRLKALQRDPKFAPLIKKYGSLAPDSVRRKRSVFEALLRAVVYQQLSGKAAAAIHGRIVALFPRKKPTPGLLLKVPPRKLRGCGLSASKTGYVRDLAERFADGAVPHRKFPSMSSQEIVDTLVQIRGVGEWTAHMVLIFTLERPDVLPVGDLGIRKGFRVLYGLRELPDRKRMERLARNWREHASLASRYLWKLADDTP